MLGSHTLSEPIRDLPPIGVVPRHAQMQRFRPAERKPAVEWPRNGPGGILQKCEPLGYAVVTNHRDTPDHIAVAIEVFSRRVKYNVRTRTNLERPLEKRRRERIVHDQQGVRAMSDLGYGRDISQTHQRVG